MHSRRLLIGLLAIIALALTACGGGNLNLGDLGKVAIKPCAVPSTLPVTTKVAIDCTAVVKPPKTTTTTASSTTTTVPTTTTTTSTTTTTTTTPPAGETWPTLATTGYRAGTSFTTVAGGTHVTTPGQVIDGWHVTGDLLVDVPGVTIKNSWIEGYLDNEGVPFFVDQNGTPPARMTVQDTTIGDTGTGTCNEQPGLGEHDYTATRVKIINHGDGFRGSGSNVTVKDSFVQTCEYPQAHADDFQIYCPADSVPPVPQPCQNYDVEHNTLSDAGIADFTAPLFGGSDPNGKTSNGFLANSTFSDNLLWGGVFEIFLYGEGLKIDHNRLMINEWQDPNVAGPDGLYHGSAYAKMTDSGLYRPIVDSLFYGTAANSWTDNLEVTGDLNAGTATVFSTTEVPRD